MVSGCSFLGIWMTISFFIMVATTFQPAVAFTLPFHKLQHTAVVPPLDQQFLAALAPAGATDQATHSIAFQYQNMFLYKHNLSLGQQERGLVNIGATNLRLRQVVAALQAGKEVSIGILGGSVSWGFYMNRGVNDWFALFTTWLQQTFPAATVVSKNGCVPATTAEYASMCLEKFVDTENVQLVFLEYSLNDGYVDTSVRTEHAMAFERLIRKLLNLPRQPAVVLMQVLPQGIRASAPPFWWSVQDHYGTLAAYYQLPWLSMRNAMWHEVMAGAAGFTVRELYPEQEQDMQRHPSELGHKYMADVAVAMMQQVFLDKLLQPVSLDDDWSQRLMQVPEPMFDSNYESSNLMCYIGDSLPSVVVDSDGWSWGNDGTADKPKWGFSTSTVGASLHIRLDTRMTAGTSADRPGQGAGGNEPDASTQPGSMSRQPLSVASSDDQTGSNTASQAAQSAQQALAAGALQPESSHPSSVTTDQTYPQALSPPHRQLQQVEHSAAWWEAQQAQEEQQERSKLEDSNRGYQPGDTLVWVGYTKTWRGGGKAMLSCLGGCSCSNVTMNGHHRWKTTQSFMAKLYTQQAQNCTIEVKVLPKSKSSNGTYFKVSGVMVTRRVNSYDNWDYTDVLLLNAMEGEDYKLKSEG